MIIYNIFRSYSENLNDMEKNMNLIRKNKKEQNIIKGKIEQYINNSKVDIKEQHELIEKYVTCTEIIQEKQDLLETQMLKDKEISLSIILNAVDALLIGYVIFITLQSFKGYKNQKKLIKELKEFNIKCIQSIRENLNKNTIPKNIQKKQQIKINMLRRCLQNNRKFIK